MRRITVSVKPNAKRESVTREGDRFDVRVAAPAKQGYANAQLIMLLAEHLDVPKSSLRIIRGTTGRTKVVEIDG